MIELRKVTNLFLDPLNFRIKVELNKKAKYYQKSSKIACNAFLPRDERKLIEGYSKEIVNDHLVVQG